MRLECGLGVVNLKHVEGVLGSELFAITGKEQGSAGAQDVKHQNTDSEKAQLWFTYFRNARYGGVGCSQHKRVSRAEI